MSGRSEHGQDAGQTGWPIVYYKPGCPFALRLKAMLHLHRVPFVGVRFRDDETGAAAARSVNHGNEISPTVRLGTTWLTNPSWREVANLVECAHVHPG